MLRFDVLLGGLPTLHYDTVKSQVAGHVFFRGPLRLTNKSGANCTPRGQHRQALFAIVALSRRGEVARAALQALLWPRSDQRKAQASLRNALSVLRKELRKLGEDLLSINDLTVRLNRDRLWIDLFDQSAGLLEIDASAALLEGLDIRANSEFEEWLRTQRAYWSEPQRKSAPRSASITKSSQNIAFGSSEDADTPLIVEIPHIDSSNSGAQQIVANALSEIVSQTGEIGNTIGQTSDSGEYISHIQLTGHVDGQRLIVRARSNGSSRELFTVAADMPDRPDGKDMNPSILALVHESVDRIAQLRRELLSRDPELQALASHALRLLFQLDPKSRLSARAMVDKVAQRRSDPVIEALRAYFETIEVGEDAVDGEPDDAQVTAALTAAHASEAGAVPGLFLTLAGYSLDFLAADSDRAGELMLRAVEADPNLPIAWDHLAMMHFWHGQFDRASAAAQRAVSLGHGSQLIGTFETSLCLAATLRGDYRRAAYYGRRALSRPDPLNDARVFYLSALGHLGEHAMAEEFIRSLESIAPHVSREQVAQRAELRMTPEGRQRLLEGLTKAGLKPV